MNEFAIYTACIGGYDHVVQPEIIDDRFDYFLFSDEVKEGCIGVWQLRHVDYTNSDKTRIARYVKTHPEELLPEYKASLWMDANIQILTPKVYERFVELFESNTDFASICHPYRNCIYDEAFEVSYSKKYGRLEHDTTAIKWCHHIFEEHYPLHIGLFETNILFRRNNQSVNDANDLWWWCINHYSKRDQLSCNYVLWKYQVKTEYYFPKGEHAAVSDNVRYVPHNKVSRRKLVKAGFFEQWRYKSINLSDWTLKKGQTCWQRAYSSSKPIIILHVYGVLLGLTYSSILLYNAMKHRITNVLIK